MLSPQALADLHSSISVQVNPSPEKPDLHAHFPVAPLALQVASVAQPLAPLQLPALQTSPWVQPSPSSQGLPSSPVAVQPSASVQASIVQGLLSSQTLA